MTLKKGQKIKFVGFGWVPEVNQIGMCLDECTVVQGRGGTYLEAYPGMFLVVSPTGRGYWIHSCQAKLAKKKAK